jgi:YHS domain-containing protein
MTDFNWCHGPECHKKHTQDRVRGVKGSKVLRTRKIKANPQWGWYSYFCSQRCYDDFTNKNIQQVIAIAPRTEALETPILDPEKKTHTYHYGFNNEHSYNRTETKIEVDETRSTDIG